MFARRFFKRWVVIFVGCTAFATGHWYLKHANTPFVWAARSYLAPAAFANAAPRRTVRRIPSIIAPKAHSQQHQLVRALRAAPIAAVHPAQKSLPFKRLALAIPRPEPRAHTTHVSEIDQQMQTPEQFAREYIVQANPGAYVDSTHVLSQEGKATTLELAVIDGTAHLTERIVLSNDNGTYEVVTEERTGTSESTAQACYNGRQWEECHGSD